MIKKKITAIKDRDPLTEKIIGCAYLVHKQLGPGFNESVYHNSLKVALKQDNLRLNTEQAYKVSYKGQNVGSFRLDLVVEERVVVEVKALTGNIPTIFELQVLSYLKASAYKVGLLINFGNKICQIRRLMV